MNFGMCPPTRLVFLTVVSCCWWTLTCVLPLVLSFLTLVRRCWWTLACALPLVLSFEHWSVAVSGRWFVCSHSSCLVDMGQPMLVDFDLCAPTRLVFFTLVSQRIVSLKTYNFMYFRSKYLQLYVLQVQGPTTLFNVGPKPCYFMLCMVKDLQLYVL